MAQAKIVLCEEMPPKAALTPLLEQYYELIVLRMRRLGIDVPDEAPQSAMAEFWGNTAGYLPPKGCLAMAYDENDAAVGCGMMTRFDAQTGELKRLFVPESQRGTGLGRVLIEAREEAARTMGLKRIVADTLVASVEMQNLYAKLGFRQCETPLETRTYVDQPMLRPHLLFYEKML